MGFRLVDPGAQKCQCDSVSSYLDSALLWVSSILRQLFSLWWHDGCPSLQVFFLACQYHPSTPAPEKDCFFPSRSSKNPKIGSDQLP